jgi:acyl carrier protein
MDPVSFVTDLGPRLARLIAETIDLDEGEVHADSRLVEDLGADSLDILDLNYRVSKEFGVNLPLVELKKRFEEADIQWLDSEGRVTVEGLAEALAVLPELGDGRIAAGQGVQAIYTVLLVRDLESMLKRALGAA